MTVLLAGLSALLYGLADFSGGFASKRSAILAVLVLSQLVGAALALGFILATGQPLPSLHDLCWSLVAGLAGFVGLFTLYRGIAGSVVAIVSPLSALVSATLPVVYGLARGERPSDLALLGTAICLPAVVLLSWEKPGSVNAKRLRSAILHGLVAGTGFGLFFIALAMTDQGSGLWPVFSARLFSLFVVLALVLFSRKKPKASASSLPWIVVAGLADMGANILFLLATRSGLLSLVAVVSSLFPAPTVVLARLVLRERIPPVRVAGLVLAIAGVALLSLR